MRDHTKLRAFVLADELALLMYEITRNYPREETYGLTAQIRRAGISVPSNIVEGCARTSHAEYLRFLELAYGSLKELHYQVGFSVRLGYVTAEHAEVCERKISETEKVLSALIRRLR